MRDRAAVDNASLQLSYATITAPVAGKIGHVSQRLGNMVRALAQTPLVTLNVLDPVDVAFAIPQQQLELVRATLAKTRPQVTAATVGALGERIESVGELTFIDNAADTDHRDDQVARTLRQSVPCVVAWGVS